MQLSKKKNKAIPMSVVYFHLLKKISVTNIATLFSITVKAPIPGVI